MIWIMVAHRSDARLFKSSGRPGDMHMIREFDYPEGRRQNREIDTDAKGSRFSTSAGRGNSTAHGGGNPSKQMKHGLDPQMEAAEHLSDIFAKELAMILRVGRTKNEYDEIILVAEPGFLGKIRKFLDKETSRMVSATLNKNLTAFSLPQQVLQLKEFIRITRRLRVA